MTAATSHTDGPIATAAEPVGVALQLRRRGVIRGLTCWSLSGSLLPIAKASSTCGGAIPVAILGKMFGDRAPLRWLGALYLRDHAEEADRDRLCRILFGEFPPQATAALAQAIAVRRLRDLARDDVEIVGGWVVTRCEARLCALIALITDPA